MEFFLLTKLQSAKIQSLQLEEKIRCVSLGERNAESFIVGYQKVKITERST